jgi:hypothetical protein
MKHALRFVILALLALLGATHAMAAERTTCHVEAEVAQLKRHLRSAEYDAKVKSVRSRCKNARLILLRVLPQTKPVADAVDLSKPPEGSGSGPTRVSESAYRASVTALKEELQERLKELQQQHGGFEKIPADDRRGFLLELREFFGLVGAKEAPAGIELEARDLLTRVSIDSPEVRLAQAMAEALERMTPEESAALAKKYPNLEKALKAPDATQRVISLLDHLEDVRKAFPEAMAAVGPGGAAVAGRAVIVARKFQKAALDKCHPMLDALLSGAFHRTRPPGVRLFEWRDVSDPDVVVDTSIVQGDTASPVCQSDHCVQFRVTMSIWGATATKARQREVFVYSEAFACDVKQDALKPTLERAAQNVFASFAAEYDAGEWSTTRASLVQPGCFNVAGTRQSVVSDWARSRRKLLSQGLTLEPSEESNWRAFEQSLRDAMHPYDKVFPLQLPGGTKTPLRLSWQLESAGGQEPPKSIRFLLREGDASKSIVEQRFTLVRTSDCLASPALQDTVALGTTVWLLGAFFGAEGQQQDEPEKEKPVETPLGLRFSAILFSGLPQFFDDDPSNDTAGAILATIDAILFTTGGALILASVQERERYSKNEGSLSKANGLLHAGMVVGGSVLIPRFVSLAW